MSVPPPKRCDRDVVPQTASLRERTGAPMRTQRERDTRKDAPSDGLQVPRLPRSRTGKPVPENSRLLQARLGDTGEPFITGSVLLCLLRLCRLCRRQRCAEHPGPGSDHPWRNRRTSGVSLWIELRWKPEAGTQARKGQKPAPSGAGVVTATWPFSLPPALAIRGAYVDPHYPPQACWRRPQPDHQPSGGNCRAGVQPNGASAPACKLYSGLRRARGDSALAGIASLVRTILARMFPRPRGPQRQPVPARLPEGSGTRWRFPFSDGRPRRRRNSRDTFSQSL